MKLAIILTILLIFLVGCSTVKDSEVVISKTTELTLNAQDLTQLKMTGTGCITEEYPTDVNSPLTQYSVCNYTILDNTEIIMELKKFATKDDLNGTYQYESSHLFSADGIISENTFGDQSKFRINSVNDYGGEFNDPNITYYHLWICKDKYLIHITSKGSKEAKDDITNIAQTIMLKFG
jgi:hypothetical protein